MTIPILNSTKSSSLLKECAKYFSRNPAFKRLFKKLREKYASLGYIGGTVTLNNLTKDEKEALGGLLRKSFAGQKSATVKLDTIQNALNQTKFAGLLLSDILDEYFGEKILSNKFIIESFLTERNIFFNGIISKYAATMGGPWLESAYTNKENAYNLLVTQYAQSIENNFQNNLDSNSKPDFANSLETFRTEIEFICIALNNLPIRFNKKTRLALFSTNITKDPHKFDIKNFCGKLLLHALIYYNCISLSMSNSDKIDSKFQTNTAEERAGIYYQCGILFDEVSSNVPCKGLLAYTETGLHMGWKGFYDNNEVVCATLTNIGNLSCVQSINNVVFVVENPTVFSSISDTLCDMPIPLICTSGQLKIVSLALLDLLVQNGCVLYYSGDYDPEGLQIADKLCQRYNKNDAFISNCNGKDISTDKDNHNDIYKIKDADNNNYKDKIKNTLILWRYSCNDYNLSVSKKHLSTVRLRKLDNINNPELKELANTIKQCGFAGYQESIINLLIDDIRATVQLRSRYTSL